MHLECAKCTHVIHTFIHHWILWWMIKIWLQKHKCWFQIAARNNKKRGNYIFHATVLWLSFFCVQGNKYSFRKQSCETLMTLFTFRFQVMLCSLIDIHNYSKMYNSQHWHFIRSLNLPNQPLFWKICHFNCMKGKSSAIQIEFYILGFI